MNHKGLSVQAQPQRGWVWTIAEIFVLIALILVMVALVEPGDMGGGGSISQAQIAKLFVTRTVDAPLQAYRHDTGNYPTTAQGIQALISVPSGVAGWKGPYFPLNENKIPLDPWGHPYQYAYPGPRNGKAKPDIWSLGPDTRTDSADYIGNW